MKMFWADIYTMGSTLDDWNVIIFEGEVVCHERNGSIMRPNDGSERFVRKELIHPSYQAAQHAAVMELAKMKDRFNRCIDRLIARHRTPVHSA